MRTNTYLGIQHLDKPPIKVGGLCEFYFAKREDVELWPLLNPETNTYTTPILLREGATWYRCQVIDPERDYTEESKSGDAGPFVELKLGGFLPDDSPINTISVGAMAYHDYIILLRERNGIQRLIGHEDAGAKFSHVYDSSDGDGTRGRRLQFTFKNPSPAGIYLSIVTANGDVINPPWPGGGGPEVDPTVPAWVKAISQAQIANWSAAFGWGNHATAGYLTQLLGDARYAPLAHSHALSDLTDVSVTAVQDGQLVRRNEVTGKWENWTPNFSVQGHQHNFQELLNIPTSIEGYGITDFAERIAPKEYTAVADGETVIPFPDKIGWKPAFVVREIKPLTSLEYSWDAESGELTLIPGAALEQQQTLFVLFVKQ